MVIICCWPKLSIKKSCHWPQGVLYLSLPPVMLILSVWDFNQSLFCPLVLSKYMIPAICTQFFKSPFHFLSAFSYSLFSVFSWDKTNCLIFLAPSHLSPVYLLSPVFSDGIHVLPSGPSTPLVLLFSLHPPRNLRKQCWSHPPHPSNYYFCCSPVRS